MSSILDQVIDSTPIAPLPSVIFGPFATEVDTTDVAKDPTSVAKADRLAAYLRQGLAKAGRVTEHLIANRPVDAIVGSRRLLFGRSAEPVAPRAPRHPVTVEIVGTGGEISKPLTLHRNALTGLSERLGLPGGYVSELATGVDWQRNLLLEILNQEAKNATTTMLVRRVNGEARAILSDRFQRKDSTRLWDAFAGACDAVNAVPCDAQVDELRTWVRALIPTIHQAAGEPVAFGMEWSNSDFGVGANTARLFTMRCVCLNGMVGQVASREVHLGGKLEEGDVSFSEKTHDLTSQASASKLGDVVRGYLSPERIEAQIAALDTAADTRIDPDKATKWLNKSQGKGRAEEIMAAFRSGEVTMLPPGDTAWRLSNAASWCAKKQTPERQHEMEELAAELIQPALLKVLARA